MSAAEAEGFTKLQADAAAQGIRVLRLADASGAITYLVGRWAWSRTCASLDAARELVKRMGGRHESN